MSLFEPRLFAPYYERSGWPVLLAPIAREAWRRFRKNELREEEFYCGEAQMAGMCHRNPDLAESVSRGRADLRPDQIKRETNPRTGGELWPNGISMN